MMPEIITSPPNFPPKNWIKRKEKQFLTNRIDQLQIYFNNLLHNQIYLPILDSSCIKDFLYTLIWSELKENNKNSLENLLKIKNKNKCNHVNLIKYKYH